MASLGMPGSRSVGSSQRRPQTRELAPKDDSIEESRKIFSVLTEEVDIWYFNFENCVRLLTCGYLLPRRSSSPTTMMMFYLSQMILDDHEVWTYASSYSAMKDLRKASYAMS